MVREARWRFHEVIGERLSHYRILAKLGEGGMSQVFLALDEDLGRNVALKLLPATLADDPRRLQRFKGEAKTLASLNHPNIVTVYSVEEFEGRHFFTMELVEGKSLENVIPVGGLELEECLSLAIPLCEALAAAHEKGVVHRDLKPNNVMVCPDGVPTVLDFGLAKREGPESRLGEAITEDGLLLGTGPYMAPEQVRGEPVDFRTDIFSFGVLLYEMATGERPFSGGTAAELLSAILRDEPVPPSTRKATVPRELSRLIERCLRKDPRKRWQSTLDLLHELEAMRDASSGRQTDVRSIAVLPFADMSESKDQDYFCEGIAEELINALNRVEGLRVASRTSSFQFGGASSDIREIGRKLDVDTILEGGVRKADDKLRITAELIDIESGYCLLSQKFDRRLHDIFAIQEEIAAAIVEELRGALRPQDRRAIERPAASIEAYDLYLRGRQFFSQYRELGMEFALEMFERAIEVDEQYALAWAGIADCCSYLYANAGHRSEHMKRALEASRRALEINPDLAEAWTARGTALSLEGRAEQADSAFERAIELDPRLFDAEYFCARHCFTHGRAEQAISHYRRAFELRPEDYQSPLLAAQVYDDLGRMEEAAEARREGVQVARQRLRLNPDDSRALYMAANGLVALGDVAPGLQLAGRAREIEPDDPMTLYNLACIYSMAGEASEAIGCLEAALANGFSNLSWLERDNNLDNVRGDPRFAALLEAPTVPV
jgi:non-specific serine/threonine protein kinase